jgi:hypothetical protein
MRVRDISFHDLQEQGSDLDKKMDFPLALMKTAQAVIQDGHKLFRFGSTLRLSLTAIVSCYLLLL